ncbi:MAG: M1 family metallopeptidase [Acidobacteriota bacterium]
MEAVFDRFFNLGLDLEHPLEVRGLRLVRDALELRLEKGIVYLSHPLSGEVTGALFIGEGRMTLTPPSPMERKSLRREYGGETVDEPFTEAILRFDDGTDKEILAAAGPGRAAAGGPERLWRARNRILYGSEDLQIDFLESRISGLGGRDFFLADLHTLRQKWISFTYRGRSSLEVSLARERATGAAGKRWYEPWCVFHKRADYNDEGYYDLMPESDSKDPVALRHVEMIVEIPDTKTVRVDATSRVEALVEGVRAVRFDLVNNLGGPDWEDQARRVNVEAVEDGDGTPLPHLHKWHQLLVLLPRPLSRGEQTRIRVRASEDTIIQLTPKSYWIYTTYPWFPQIGHGGGRYTFDWTVKVAKPMMAVGSGELVREWEEEGMNCGRWRSTAPVHFASFIFGEFKVTTGAYRRAPPASGEVALRLYSIKGGRVAAKGKKENILFNIEQGLRSFEAIFGPFPYEDLDIAQMEPLLGFAQSPAGLLLLNWVIRGGGGGGTADQVIFHELAHQWWGNQVGWVGPEDDWISESWAEYAAGLITEGIDRKKFREKLREWKREARQVDAKATIANAYHVPQARTGLLYSKGPYVVHMLRTWMGWEKFTRLTSTLQSKYKDREINTDTIAREASALMGYDMFPFFDQWVRDQGIPTIRYSWSAKEEPDGSFLVTVRARQEDRENFKYMMVPVSLDFGKGDPVVLMKPILKPEVTMQFRAPARPREIRLDDENTQLADFIRVRN